MSRKSTTDGLTELLGPPDLPAPSRPIGRARSQRLLMTMLGEHWEAGRPPIASAALVHLLECFDISATNSRAAFSRLAKRGMLERTKDGRSTSYRPTVRSMQLLTRGAERIFAVDDERSWDGTWTLVAFSLPNHENELRRNLRKRLRWLTFAPMYDATWVTPQDRLADAQDQLSDLGISDALVLRSRDLQILPDGRERLEAAWRLSDLADSYRAHRRTYDDVPHAMKTHALAPRDAFVLRTEMVDNWRLLLRSDPDLPREYLPDDFPRGEARKSFLRAYQALAAPSREYFDAVTKIGVQHD